MDGEKLGERRENRECFMPGSEFRDHFHPSLGGIPAVPPPQIPPLWTKRGKFPGLRQLPGFFQDPIAERRPRRQPHIHPCIHTWIQLSQEKRLGRGSLERIPRQKGKKSQKAPIKTPSSLGAFSRGSLGMFAAGGGASRWPSSWHWGKAFFPRFFAGFFPVFPHFGGSQSGWIPDGIETGMRESLFSRKSPGKKPKNPSQPPEQNRRSPRISSWN